MKRPDFLYVSLMVNALLVLALGWQLRPTGRPRHGEPAMSESAGALPRNPAAAVDRTKLGDPSLGPFGRQPIQWPRFSVGDWTRYRDELLACGCPRNTVREIIQPLVDRSFNRRGRELTAPLSARFWEFFCPPAKDRMEVVEKRFAALEAERRTVLEQLFPSGWATAESGRTGRPDERLAFLDPDKQQQVTAAEENYEALVAEARATQPDGELVAQLIQQAASNREAEVARILTPEELAEFKVRSSPNSGWVRALEGIQLAETELAEITRIRDRATASHNQPMAINPTEASNEQAALGKLLGPERFEEFKRAQDGNYQQLVLLTRRLGLETAMAGSLWQTRRTFQEQAAALTGDAALSREQRQAALLELRRRQEQVVGHLLPDEDARAAWNLQQTDWLKRTFALPAENPLADWFKEP